MAVFIASSCSQKQTLKSSFPKLKWSPTLKDQKIVVDKEFQEKNISGKKMTFEGELKAHQLIAEVMVDIEPERAATLMKNKTMMIKGLYAIQATPYSGTITKEASCTAELQIDPIVMENKNQSSLQFNLKATERLVLGVCIEEQNVFRSQTLLLYCKKDKMFYDMRYYYPKSNKPFSGPMASCAN
jgi:exoribonuclease R